MELKEVITTLGLDPEKIKTIEDFKTSVDSTFTRNTLINEDSEPVKKITGKLYGTFENEIKKLAKTNDVEIDLDAPELKDKKTKDKLAYFINALSEKNKTVITELEGKVGLGNDEKVKELEKKFEKTSQKAKDLQALLEATTNEYNTYKETSANQIKGVKLDVLKKDAFGKVKFKNDISEFEKKGYFSTIQENYLLDIDENESLVVKDKKGSLIPSTKVTGTFKTVAEILEEEAVKGKLYQLNGDGGKPKPQGLNLGNPAQPNGARKAVVAPRMR